jgi:hypothetical protein
LEIHEQQNASSPTKEEDIQPIESTPIPTTSTSVPVKR